MANVIIGNTLATPIAIPTKVSQLENDAEYITVDQMEEELDGKADTPVISTNSIDGGSQSFLFERRYNEEVRLARKDGISFKFGNGEYEEDYVAGLSFDSGATPTAIDYTDSGIINWVGTDCSTFTYQINPEGDLATISLFIPSPNTHYDIVFYFNGMQFIGLVNGYVSANGNVVSE